MVYRALQYFKMNKQYTRTKRRKEKTISLSASIEHPTLGRIAHIGHSGLMSQIHELHRYGCLFENICEYSFQLVL